MKPIRALLHENLLLNLTTGWVIMANMHLERQRQELWKSAAILCSYYGCLLHQSGTKWFNLPLKSRRIPLHCAPLGLSAAAKSCIFLKLLTNASYRKNYLSHVNETNTNETKLFHCIQRPRIEPRQRHLYSGCEFTWRDHVSVTALVSPVQLEQCSCLVKLYHNNHLVEVRKLLKLGKIGLSVSTV